METARDGGSGNGQAGKSGPKKTGKEMRMKAAGLVRGFQKEDLDRVMQIWLEANLQAHAFIPEEYWKNHYEEVRSALLDAEVCVYENAGRVEAFIGMQGNEIAGIFAAEGMRSGGMGRELLNRVKRKHPVLELSVYQKNTKAVRFYLREGFQFVDEGRKEPATGEMEYRMKWRAGISD